MFAVVVVLSSVGIFNASISRKLGTGAGSAHSVLLPSVLSVRLLPLHVLSHDVLTVDVESNSWDTFAGVRHVSVRFVLWHLMLVRCLACASHSLLSLVSSGVVGVGVAGGLFVVGSCRLVFVSCVVCAGSGVDGVRRCRCVRLNLCLLCARSCAICWDLVIGVVIVIVGVGDGFGICTGVVAGCRRRLLANRCRRSCRNCAICCARFVSLVALICVLFAVDILVMVGESVMRASVVVMLCGVVAGAGEWVRVGGLRWPCLRL